MSDSFISSLVLDIEMPSTVSTGLQVGAVNDLRLKCESLKTFYRNGVANDKCPCYIVYTKKTNVYDTRTNEGGCVCMPEDPYYLIRRSHLPEVMRKTVEVMELLQRRKDINVQEAVQQVGISRSAFYKYKDAVKPFYSTDMGRIITLSLTLRHIAGVLSKVLDTFSRVQANILTINQAIPLQGSATVTVSLDTQNVVVNMESLLRDLREINGVEEVTLVGQSA